MEKKMSIWGVGPVLFPLSFGYFTVIVLLSYYYYPYFQIKFIPYPMLVAFSIFLLIIGVPFWIISLRTILKACKAGNLVTSGVFRCCRHPLYSAWTIFNVPAIVLLTNSWLALTTPIFMYCLLTTLIKKEEKYMESLFGFQYLEYKNKVPGIIPYGWLKT